MKRKISYKQLRAEFAECDEYKDQVNIEMAELLEANMADAITMIENIVWNKLGKERWDLFPAITSLMQAIFI